MSARSTPERRRVRCRLVGALTLAALGGACEVATAPARPNVILVTLDTTRADYFTSYGYDLPTTPNFDALGARGVQFETCIASAALTPVSHATILTGLEPYHHGLRVLLVEEAAVLPDRVATLAETLSSAGYSTAAFLSAFPVSRRYGLDQGFSLFDEGFTREADELEVDPRIGVRQAQTQRRSDLTTDRALAWLAQVEEPFFVWIHYWDPHDPRTVPPPDALQRFAAESSAAGRPDPSLYASEVRYVDEQFGRLLEGLEQDPQLENTLVAVTADHGEGLGEHDWGEHRILYQEQIHVPLLMAWPGGPRGRRVDALVRTTDIVPTVLDVLDLPVPGQLDGQSLVGLAQGRAEEPRTAYAENLALWDTNCRISRERPRDALLYAAIQDGWKLVYRPQDPGDSELYDLANDPYEAVNRSAEQAERVRQLLTTIEDRAPLVLAPLGQGSVDPAAAAALRELGYLGETETAGTAQDER